jgi:acyl-coenzyme A synthetase/AMP-(fatty) acid ligase/thioesterase domain-containing protein/acyl carrier protein
MHGVEPIGNDDVVRLGKNHRDPRARAVPLVDLDERTRTNAYLTHSDHTVSSAMHEIAQQIPDRLAIDTGPDQITFAELNARANQVASALLDRDLDRSTPVFLLCDHGAAPPVAICGVLHAGLIGAPVDVLEPEARLRRLFDVSTARWVVTDRAHLDIARVLTDQIFVLDEAVSYATDTPDVTVDDDWPGLILFTSGSTGEPKGVVSRHRTIVPKAMRHGVHKIVGDERYALTASWGFTAAEVVLFNGLINGRPTCTYDLRMRGIRDLPGWARSKQVTSMSFMPSVLRALVETAPPGAFDFLVQASFGGETLYGADLRAARPLFGPDTRFSHGLGSTEAGGIASYDIPRDAEVDDGPVPVGLPGAQCEVRIVDEDDQELPDGEIGRIVLVRRGHLALGYWRDPELAAEHFFVEPDGRRGFRTSDRGRWRTDGLLEHLGRLDTRVKVRGAMVATSEVEIALMSLDGVADAAVIVATLDDGGTRLVAYVVGDGHEPLSAWRLRRDLATRVPTTMVPNAFVAVEELPRTVRDKLDRAALPPPPPPVRPRPYRAPEGSARELAEVFAMVLGVDRVGLDDDFFELGGDSLAVLELLAEIADRFQVDIPASTVLAAPTVAQLGLRLSYRRPRDASPVVALRTRVSPTPFFCVTGGGAPAMSLRALSQAIPAWDFYAVQPRGLEERARPDRTVTAAARRNLAAIRAVQPHGPYALAGYSFGGYIAFEIACQLRAHGEDVALLVILDAAATPKPPSLHQRFTARSASLRLDAPTHSLLRAAALTTRAVRFGFRSTAAHTGRRIALTTAGMIPRRGYRQYDTFLRLNARMAINYQPNSTFDGPVLVVRSATSIGPPSHFSMEPPAAVAERDRHRPHDLGWSQLVSGPVTVTEVPGEHLDLLRPPAVGHVAASINEALAAARLSN